MEDKEKGNVGISDVASAYERWKKFQEDHPDLELKPGQWVRLPFFDRDRDMHEWMWVVVTEVLNKDAIGFGFLDNDPLVVDMACGDPVTFDYRNISAIKNNDTEGN